MIFNTVSDKKLSRGFYSPLNGGGGEGIFLPGKHFKEETYFL